MTTETKGEENTHIPQDPQGERPSYARYLDFKLKMYAARAAIDPERVRRMQTPPEGYKLPSPKPNP